MSILLPNPCIPFSSSFPLPPNNSVFIIDNTITQATDGATSLESLSTTALATNQWLGVKFTYDSVGMVPIVDPQANIYVLESSNAATSAPSIVRPLDYNATTNARVWFQRL